MWLSVWRAEWEPAGRACCGSCILPTPSLFTQTSKASGLTHGCQDLLTGHQIPTVHQQISAGYGVYGVEMASKPHSWPVVTAFLGLNWDIALHPGRRSPVRDVKWMWIHRVYQCIYTNSKIYNVLYTWSSVWLKFVLLTGVIALTRKLSWCQQDAERVYTGLQKPAHLTGQDWIHS